MATSEQFARGVQIARQVQEEYPDMPPAGKRALIHARWKAVERDVAAMRRPPW